MGFFSNLFGGNQVSEEVKKEVREKFIANFFGVDLKKAPDDSWKYISSDVNTSGDVVKTYSSKVSSPYFKKCEAKVIGNSATNFFFEARYNKDHALDIVFLVERDMFRGGQYKLLDCITKYKNDILSEYCNIEWKDSDMTIWFDRRDDGNTMHLSVWTSYCNVQNDEKENEIVEEIISPELNTKNQQSIPAFFEGLWYENFFGLNLLKSPNETWEFLGLSTSANGNKLEKFENKNLGNICTFKSCEAIVIGDSATNFFFEKIPFNVQYACKLLHQLEYSVAGNTAMSYDDCVKKYQAKLDGSYETFSFDGNVEGKNYHVELNVDSDNTMKVSAFTCFVNEERPDINGSRSGEFVADKTEIFQQAKSMAEVACVLGSINGEIIGTKDTIKDMNMFMCQLVGMDSVPNEDKMYTQFLPKGDEVKIEKVEGEHDYSVTSLDGSHIIGYMPDALNITLGIMIPNEFIKQVTIFEKVGDSVRVLVKFEQ